MGPKSHVMLLFLDIYYKIVINNEGVVMSKIQVIGAGGAGGKVVRKLRSVLEDNGIPDGVSVGYRVVDTSNLNGETDAHITSGVNVLNGSGGERIYSATDIIEYINSNNFGIDMDLTIIIFSASGGSGSVIGPVLTEMLRKDGHSVLPICILDTVSEMYETNTIKTLMGMDAIAINNDFALPIMLHNNASSQDVVDATIIEDISKIIEFHRPLSDIDARDMELFWKQEKYITVDVDPGIYVISTGNSTVIESDNVIGVRVISSKTRPPAGKVVHYKESVEDKVYKDDDIITLVSEENVFYNIFDEISSSVTEKRQKEKRKPLAGSTIVL